MGLILFFLIAIAFVFGICFFVGGKTTKNTNSWLQRHPGVAKPVVLAYVVFAGCFVFPISSEPFPLDFMKLYLLISSYGIIGLGFAGVYGPAKGKAVYLSVLPLTILGMACRYFLEYGETSNAYNFTAVNILSYLVILPAFTAVSYHCIVKYLVAKKQEA